MNALLLVHVDCGTILAYNLTSPISPSGQSR